MKYDTKDFVKLHPDADSEPAPFDCGICGASDCHIETTPDGSAVAVCNTCGARGTVSIQWPER